MRYDYMRRDCGTFYSDNILLCKNASFWEKIPCAAYDAGLKANGTRCRGNSQQCIFPWYTDEDGYTRNTPGFLKTCPDKSDEIFNDGTICSNISYNYISIYNDNWCNITGQVLTFARHD